MDRTNNNMTGPGGRKIKSKQFYLRWANPTLAQHRDDNAYIQYCMVINRLERDYGIDRVSNIIRPWREYEPAKKLELAKWLAETLDNEECQCREDRGEDCAVCKQQKAKYYGDRIPIVGEL